ncbi:hypothetical protein HDU98_002938 [Podochytrium sp. JEL0797]|nr:hypothetical protein HDU98_002938 [Podochytrium sp. JEL0797]
MSISELAGFAAEASRTGTGILHFPPSQQSDRITCTVFHLLVAFPDVLQDVFLSNGSPVSLLNTPIFSETQLAPLTFNTSPISPFILALWCNLPASASKIAQLGGNVALKPLADHIMKFPWTSHLSVIVDAFTQKANLNPLLWGIRDPLDGSNFLMMLAQHPPVAHSHHIQGPADHLHAFLNKFPAHIPSFARQKNDHGVDAYNLTILRGHKVLFEWFRTQPSVSDFQISDYVLGKLMFTGAHAVFTSWFWPGGETLMPFQTLRHWYWFEGKEGGTQDRIRKFVVPDRAVSVCFGPNHVPVVDHLRVYGSNLLHVAVFNLETVKFLVETAKFHPNSPFKVRSLETREKFHMTATELALAVKADKTAFYLLDIPSSRCSDEYIIHRLVAVDAALRDAVRRLEASEVVEMAEVSRIEWLYQRYTAQPRCCLHVLTVTPDLPLALRAAKVPVGRVSYLFKVAGYEVNSAFNPAIGSFLHVSLLTMDFELATFLLESGANVSAVDSNLNTPLHLLCANLPETNTQVALQFATRLVSMSRDLENTSNACGLTPFIILIMKEACNPTEGVDWFGLLGITTETRGWTILHLVARVFVALARGETLSPGFGLQAEHLVPVMKKLLEVSEQNSWGWDVNCVNGDGETVLDFMSSEIVGAGSAVGILEGYCRVMREQLDCLSGSAVGKRRQTVEGEGVKRKFDPRLALGACKKQRTDVAEKELSLSKYPVTDMVGGSDRLPVRQMNAANKLAHHLRKGEFHTALSVLEKNPSLDLACVEVKGELPLHTLANTSSYRGKHGLKIPTEDLEVLLRLVHALVNGLGPTRRDELNRLAMNAMSISILRDACSFAGGFFVAAKKAPHQSVMTMCLEMSDCTPKGKNRKGQTVAHGLILTWFESIRSGSKPIQSVCISSALTAVKGAGVSMKEVDDNEETPLSLLIGGGDIDWDSVDGRLREDRVKLIDSLKLLENICVHHPFATHTTENCPKVVKQRKKAEHAILVQQMKARSQERRDSKKEAKKEKKKQRKEAEMAGLVFVDHLLVYGSNLLHVAMFHLEMVKFLVETAKFHPNSPFKVQSLETRKNFHMMATELALAIKADKMALYLLDIPSSRCGDE